jgi:ABC-type transport system involved in cytochrome c biogenesis permease component
VKFLPIAERELRVAARRRSTYWLRFAMPLGLLVLAIWVFLANQRDSQREIGMMIFYLLTGGLTLYALTAGLRSTADSLAEEKRDGTLGLLFLTDLRGYDVVIGKLLANSLSVFYGVLAVLPILAIPLLMGGVAGAEFGRLALVLVNTLFFSLCAGMLASALCQQARAATAATLAIILLIAGGIPALGLLEWKTRHWQGNYLYPFLVPSPVFSYVAGVDQMFKRGIGQWFFWSVGSVHLSGWLCLALASRIVRNRWQDRPATVRGLERRSWWRGIFEGDAAQRHAFRTRLLDQNAFCWLATQPRHRAWWSWTPLGIAALAWVWGGLKLGRDWFNPGIYATTAVLLAISMKVMIGAEAGRRLLEDRKIGSLELLLSTPLSVRDILRGQGLALWRQFGGPVLMLFAVAFLMLVAGYNHWHMGGNERTYWLCVGLAGMVMFVADAVALYWVGMWFGLSSKNPRHAFGAAITPILALPWIGVALVMSVIGLLPYEVRREFRGDYWVWVLWFGFSMVADFCFGYVARRTLLTEFRELATQRFQPKPGWWQRFFGKG